MKKEEILKLLEQTVDTFDRWGSRDMSEAELDELSPHEWGQVDAYDVAAGYLQSIINKIRENKE